MRRHRHPRLPHPPLLGALLPAAAPRLHLVCRCRQRRAAPPHQQPAVPATSGGQSAAGACCCCLHAVCVPLEHRHRLGLLLVEVPPQPRHLVVACCQQHADADADAAHRHCRLDGPRVRRPATARLAAAPEPHHAVVAPRGQQRVGGGLARQGGQCSHPVLVRVLLTRGGRQHGRQILHLEHRLCRHPPRQQVLVQRQPQQLLVHQKVKGAGGVCGGWAVGHRCAASAAGGGGARCCLPAAVHPPARSPSPSRPLMTCDRPRRARLAGTVCGGEGLRGAGPPCMRAFQAPPPRFSTHDGRIRHPELVAQLGGEAHADLALLFARWGGCGARHAAWGGRRVVRGVLEGRGGQEERGGLGRRMRRRAVH